MLELVIDVGVALSASLKRRRINELQGGTSSQNFGVLLPPKQQAMHVRTRVRAYIPTYI